MTPQDLARATGARIDRAQTFLPIIEIAAPDFGIDNDDRMAAFLAQVGHESGGLHWLVEIWGPTEAQRRYEGREDLGNTEPGDGPRFKGRGLIQITGRSNYGRCSQALYGEMQHLIDHPEILELPDPAARSAGWFWLAHHLNEPADQGAFERITRIINGGTNGLMERVAYHERAQRVLA